MWYGSETLELLQGAWWCPLKRQVLTDSPITGSLFGNRIFADRTVPNEIILELACPLNTKTRLLLEKGGTDLTHTGERSWKMVAEIGVTRPQARGHRGPSETGRHEEEFCQGWGHVALMMPLFQSSSLQDSERIGFCSSESLICGLLLQQYCETNMITKPVPSLTLVHLAQWVLFSSASFPFTRNQELPFQNSFAYLESIFVPLVQKGPWPSLCTRQEVPLAGGPFYVLVTLHHRLYHSHSSIPSFHSPMGNIPNRKEGWVSIFWIKTQLLVAI